MIVNGYEILVRDKHQPTVDISEYEELSLSEFLDSQNLSEEEKNDVVRSMFAVNIHFMLAEETFDRAMEILNDRLTDHRLAKMNAIVFLAYKPKGTNRGEFHTIRDIEKYKKIIAFCAEHNISFGCDSCSAPMVLKAYHDNPLYEKVAPVIEPCEASCFSSYISCHGKFYPCSFTEGEPGWRDGIDVLSCNSFVSDVWNNPKVEEFRSRLMKSTESCIGCKSQSICRSCPTFDLKSCQV